MVVVVVVMVVMVVMVVVEQSREWPTEETYHSASLFARARTRTAAMDRQRKVS
jgi:hypothetical protein